MALQIKPWPIWAAPFKSPSRYKAAYGGRESGKSHQFAQMLVERCIIDHNLFAVGIREVQKSIAYSVKALIEQKIGAIGASEYFDIQDTVIKRRGGTGKIIFAGLQDHTADSLKSLEGVDIAWVEEAQSLSQRSLDILRPTIRKPGSELWFSWNPDTPSDPVDVFFRGEFPPDDAIIIEVNYDKNPWFKFSPNAKELERDRQRDPEKFAHVWLGKYKNFGSSVVFKNWECREFDTPPDAVLRFGADWGFASDPSVLIRCYIVGRTLYVDYEVYEEQCEIIDLPTKFMQIPGAERWPIVADSSRPETISHMRRHGFPKIVPAVKGPRSVEDGVEWLKSFDIVVHPRCEHTVRELTLYSYKIDKKTSTVLPELEDKDNHVIDALRYACESARRAQRAAEEQSMIGSVKIIPTVHHWR